MKENVFCDHSIVIRRRGASELADLTLTVIREQWRPIFFYFFILALPALILNLIIYYTLFLADGAFFSANSSEEATSNVLAPFILCSAMVIELRFVGTLLISWLGLWVFHPGRTIKTSEVFGVWFNVLPQLLFYLVLFCPFYFFSEFIPQIVLLEQTPFFSRSSKLTTSRRASYFHRGLDIGIKTMKTHACWLVVFFAFIGYFFFGSWGSTLVFFSPLWDPVFKFVLFPFYFWVLLLFYCVFSFFRYLNIRITREGWDLDIAFKAEMLRRRGDIPVVAIAPVSFETDRDELYIPKSNVSHSNVPETSSFTINPADDLAEVNALVSNEESSGESS